MDARADAGGAKRKAGVSPARNLVGVILLLIFGGAAAAEFYGQSRFNSAVNAIQKRVPRELDPYTDVPERITRSEAEKILGRPADGPLVDEEPEKRATYTWQGLFRRYQLKAYYTGGDSQKLIRVSTE